MSTINPCRKIYRTALTIREKVEIINAVEKGLQRKSAIASKYGIANSTLSTLLKNKERIFKTSRTIADPNRKRSRPPAYPILEEKLTHWINSKLAKNEPFDRSGLRAKVREFAPALGIVKFSVSDGWLERFQRRHGLSFRPKRVQRSTLPDALPVVLPSLLVPSIAHDSDGAGSERSSDSDNPVFPVQLIQCERQKRQKRSLSEARPEFIFYGEGAMEKSSEQMVVPHSVEQPAVTFPDHDKTDEPFEDHVTSQEPETIIKVEEPVSENSSDDSEWLPHGLAREEIEQESTAVKSIAQSSSSISEEFVPPLTSSPQNTDDNLAFFNNIDALINAVSTAPKNPTNAVDVLSKDKEVTIWQKNDKATQVYCKVDPAMAPGQQTNNKDLSHLADVMERQARTQEELLAFKKTKSATAEKHHQEEMELLKQRLQIEEKKVAALEKMLSSCMEMLQSALARDSTPKVETVN